MDCKKNWIKNRKKQIILKNSIAVLQKHRKFYGLSLTVLDSDSGLPVSSARVSLDGVYHGATDINGRLSIRSIPAGIYNLIVEASYFEKTMVKVKISEQQKLNTFLKRTEIPPPPPPVVTPPYL